MGVRGNIFEKASSSRWMAVMPLLLGAENLEPSPLLGHHACPIVLVVGLLLKEHVVDEESRSDEGGLATYVKVHGEPAKKN